MGPKVQTIPNDSSTVTDTDDTVHSWPHIFVHRHCAVPLPSFDQHWLHFENVFLRHWLYINHNDTAVQNLSSDGHIHTGQEIGGGAYLRPEISNVFAQLRRGGRCDVHGLGSLTRNEWRSVKTVLDLWHL